MPQILPSQPTFAGQLGSGLGSALQNLVSEKVQQMQAQQGQARLASTLQKSGYSPEQAELIGALPQKDLLSALQSLAPSAPQAASQQLSQVQPESQQGHSLQNALQQLKAQTPEVSGLELLKQAGTQKLSEIGLGQNQPQQPGFAPINAQELFEQARLQGIALTPEQQQKINNKVAAINASEDLQKQLQSFIAKQSGQKQMAPEVEQALTPQPLFKKPLTETERIARERLELKKGEISEKEIAGGEKESKSFFENTLKEANAAKASDKRLDRMEKLIKKGNLPSALWYKTFKGLSEVGAGDSAIPIVGPLIGLLANPIGGLGLTVQRATSSDVEEFEKLSADFVKDVKNFFPGRISNAELDAFLATIPTLSQTDQGKINIIENMRSFNKVAELRAKATKDIIRENNNRRPGDLELKVDERISKQLDKVADEFKNRIGKPIQYEPRERYLGGLLPKLPSATGF